MSDSTHYYAKTTDSHAPHDLHIGQHVPGWEFLFRAHPDLGLTSTLAWRKYLEAPGVTIVTDGGFERTLAEFWPLATAWTDRDGPVALRPNLTWADPPGWRDEARHAFAADKFDPSTC